MTAPHALGVDIGGTKTLAALVDGDGTPGTSHVLPTPASNGARAVLDCAVELALTAAGSNHIDYLGIGAAGVIDHHTGRVLSATSALPGWQGTDIRAAFAAAFPSASVQVINDVQAFTLAESKYGAGSGVDTVLGVTAGTGIGGALVLGGTIHWGASNAAGHIGHVLVTGAEGQRCSCGKTGHLEAVASGTAMTEIYRKGGGTAETLRDVARAAAAGDDSARAVLDHGADALGSILGSVANMVDPDVVVMGGGMTGLGAEWLERVRAAAHATTIPAIGRIRIEASTLGGKSAAIGAACAARDLHRSRNDSRTAGEHQ